MQERATLFGLGIFWARFTTGWDDTLLTWADQARRQPNSAQVWTSSAGVQQPMPAWTALSEQQRLLLQVLAGLPADSVPLAALSAALVTKAKASHTQHLLAQHALQNCTSVWQQPQLSAEEQMLHVRWKLEDWAAACVQIAEKHSTQRQG